MEPIRQHQGGTGADVVLADALGSESPVLRVFRTGGCPAVSQVADALSANDHQDREILLLSEVYLELCNTAVILKSQTGPGVHAASAINCREMGRLGARLSKGQPKSIRGTRALVRLVDRILEAREDDSQPLAFAQGPAEEFLKLALGCLKNHALPNMTNARKEP